MRSSGDRAAHSAVLRQACAASWTSSLPHSGWWTSCRKLACSTPAASLAFYASRCAASVLCCQRSPSYVLGSSELCVVVQVPVPRGHSALHWLQGQDVQQTRLFFSPRCASAPQTPASSLASAASAGLGATAGAEDDCLALRC